MTLDPDTLQLLAAKDSRREVHWGDSQSVFYLEASSSGDAVWTLDANGHPIKTGLGISVSSPLSYAGCLLTASKGVFGITSGTFLSDLIHEGTPLALPGPSTDLTITNDHRFSWVSHDSATGTDTVYRLHEQTFEKVVSRQAFIRLLHWHPQRALCVYLSWSFEELPWHDAKLWFHSAESREEPSVSEPLFPPGAEEAPCGEARWSPDGTILAATFRTGEFFQVWSYDIKSKTWAQLTSDGREHCRPFRRSGPGCLTFSFRRHPTHSF